LRLLQKGKQFADLAQFLDGLVSHGERHAPRGSEQIAEQRNIKASRLFKQQCRTAGAQRTATYLGDFQARVHRRGNALEFAQIFQVRDEIPQVLVFHGTLTRNAPRMARLWSQGSIGGGRRA
jgi:hypothetical protein